jgi:homoserine acetyltransferase
MISNNMGNQNMLPTEDLKNQHANSIRKSALRVLLLQSEPNSRAELKTESDRANFYSAMVQNQHFALIPSFTLESGATLQYVPVAYSTWGTLNENGDNALVLCHALTGSSDALDWWRPLMGPGKALDSSRYFIFCANVLGSPYVTLHELSNTYSHEQIWVSFAFVD